MRNLVSLVALGCLVLVGCGDETDVTPDAGDVGADVMPDVEPEDCTGITVAAVVGGECGGFTPCVTGAQCARVAEEGTGFCRQICVPNTCESVCQSGQECITLAESPGTGVCVERLVGTVQAYEECTDSDGCAEPYQCLVGSVSADAGVCLPPCDEANGCIAHNGRSGECVIRVSAGAETTSYCAAECSAPGADDECAGGMQCLDTGAGSSVCAFPTPGN